MPSIYLGIDIGTTSAKCLAVLEDGEILAFAQHPYPVTHPRQDWAEQDAEEYWRGLSDTVRHCVHTCKQEGYNEADIAALALSTQGDTLIVTDDRGRPLAPALTWMDGRAEVECDELLAEVGASFWYRQTGIPLTPLSSACKIRWLQRHAPELTQGSTRFCWVADFLARKLSGEFVTDVPAASWTPLFSPTRRAWSGKVLSLLGFPEDKLPATRESGTIVGQLLPEVAEELHLPPQAMFVAGAFDQAAAAHGAGATASGRSVLSCGTAWVLYSVSADPIFDDREQLCVCCHVAPSEWGLVLPFTGGSAYDWLNQNVVVATTGQPSESEPLVFIPHLYGGLSPDWRQESRGSLLGLTLSHTGEDIRLALMRGIAYEARRNLEASERLGIDAELVCMVGGAGKSETWPQIIANVLNRPVDVSEFVESACYGAVRLAARGAGVEWKPDQPLHRFRPSPTNVETEDHLYRRYLRFYEALLPPYQGEPVGGPH